MYLVTGATGNVGSEVVRALSAADGLRQPARDGVTRHPPNPAPHFHVIPESRPS